MALPAGISTATLTMGVPVTFGGNALKSTISITPSVPLVHVASGTPLVNMIDQLETNEGAGGQFVLPHTDQDGFQDEAGNAYTNWYYTAEVQYFTNGSVNNPNRAVTAPKIKSFQLTAGQSTVDFDLLPSGIPALPYSAPVPTVTSVDGLTGAVSLAAPIRAGVFAQQIDKGENFVNKLSMKTGDIAVGLAGDSTWNAMDEAADLYMAKLAVDYPSLAIGIKHWNDGTQAYDAEVSVSAGIPETGGTVFLDTFTRTAAELYGSTPDIGEVWGRDGSNANGDWTINGTQAVRTADTTTGGILATGAAGDTETTLDANLSTVGTGATRTFRVYFCYSNPTNHAFVQISIGATGTVTSWNVTSRVNNVAVAVATGASGILPASTAANPVVMVGKLQGTTLSATINGTTISGAISSADAAVLASGVQAGFSGGVAGDTLNSFKIDLVAPAAPKKLTFYNGSLSGSVLSYQESRVATLFPVPLDMLLINSGHNYGAQTPETYQTALDSFIAAFRVVQPSSGIVITSQNPQKAPASQRTAHFLRQASVKSYASRRGLGYVPGLEAFKALPDGGVTLIATDGVHPTPGATASGSSLWRDAIANYFESLVLDSSFKGVIVISPNGTRFRITVADDGALVTTSL